MTSFSFRKVRFRCLTRLDPDPGVLCCLGTVIVGTDLDGGDYAISFKDKDGCEQIWDFIIEVQRHLRGKGWSSARPLCLLRVC